MFLPFVLLTITTISSHQVAASDSNATGNICFCSSVQDVVFVIDTSSSIGDENFQLIRNFTADITTELINESPGSAVGVILFSDNAHIEFNLTAHTSLDSSLTAIRELDYNGGGTNTAAALRLLLNTAQNGELGLTNDSLNSAIVITDGQSNSLFFTSLAANALHASNIFDVYAVGVDGANPTELNRIASSPEFVFFTSSFNSDGLQQLENELLLHLCNGAVAVSLNQPQYLITENSSFLPVNVTLNRTASEDVIVEVTISDGSANTGVDYAISSALVFNVTISAGSTSSSFSIDIINDMIQEDNETFNITIRLLPSCSSLSLGTSSSTVTIIDDDLAMIDFTSPTFIGSESDEVVSVQVMILEGIISTKDIYVVITLISITAEGNNTDFNSTMQTVTIAAGTNSTTVNILVNDDGIPEKDEVFNITLSLPSSLNGAGVVLANDNAIVSATGTIIDSTITIDSTLCDNLDEQFQVSEETGCSPYEYDNLASLIEQVCEITTVDKLIAAMELLTAELVLLTNERDDGTSACPNDLITIVLLLEFIVNTTESYPAVLSSRDIIQNTADVFSNILNPQNNPGWRELRMIDPDPSQDVLIHSEAFGILLADNLNVTGSVESDNIEIVTVLVNALSIGNIIPFFNSAFDNSILIPDEFIDQRSMMTGIDFIPIATIQYKNIQNILPVTSNGTHSVQPVSQILSSQVTNTSDTSSNVPVQLTLRYSLENVSALSMPRCGFWNFSLDGGSWDTTGIITISNDMNSSTINCNSSHLTSFAVLVDVSGSQQDRSDEENQALSIVSYIGCGISLICLLIAIILLVYYRRTIFKEMQNFIHLNLAIALSLALVVFVSGIETATENDIACTVVAALLHYFFTAVFAWMLCEGILLYFLLVKVFNIGLGQKKWIYLALGWGIPVPIVAISVGIAHDQYGNDDYCWIRTDEGAIWGFVAPMIAIIIVNLIFLLLALRSLYKSENRRMTTEEVTRAQTIKTLLKISVILLPLLGIAWAFGVLAVNQESSVFAWIFTILNSLQGMFILIFQVLRNEKLRQKFTSCCKREKYDISSSKEKHIVQTKTKTSAASLSGFNTVDKITTEDGLTDSVFKDANVAENGLKLSSLEVVKDQNVSSNSSEMYNKEGSVTSLQVSKAMNSVA